jgi:hypothetical protein
MPRPSGTWRARHSVASVTSGETASQGIPRSFEVETPGGFDRLSLLTPVGQHQRRHSLRVHRTGVIETMADDAGSKCNDVLAAFIPGRGCNKPFVRDAEGALIRPDDGTTGVGDRSRRLGPARAFARITITCAPLGPRLPHVGLAVAPA